MQKIKQITNWIESDKGKDVLVVIIVILMSLGSFELGRLSKESSPAGIKIEYTDPGAVEQANVVSATLAGAPRAPSDTKNFFASNRGMKYYTLGCSGGKTIKQENRVYFATAAEAEEAGYVLSTACQ